MNAGEGRAPGTPDPTVGLCADCRYCHRLRSTRGSVFFRCRRAESDPVFEQYPRLPVLQCSGYAPQSKNFS